MEGIGRGEEVETKLEFVFFNLKKLKKIVNKLPNCILLIPKSIIQRSIKASWTCSVIIPKAKINNVNYR